MDTVSIKNEIEKLVGFLNIYYFGTEREKYETSGQKSYDQN